MISDVIAPVLDDFGIDYARTRIHVNPTGRFVIGGPQGDAGLTGRKIIVDTYGGMARHGGGAFSGKDPTKVDRSAAYAMRHVAKNSSPPGWRGGRGAGGLRHWRGAAGSVFINTFGTGKVSDERLERAVREVFDFVRPA